MRHLGIAFHPDLTYDTLRQLNDLGYVAFDQVTNEGGGGATFSGVRVTGRGQQLLGQWPRFEALTSPSSPARMIEDLADFAPAEEVEPMRRAAQVTRKVAAASLRTAVIVAGSHALRGALGLPG